MAPNQPVEIEEVGKFVGCEWGSGGREFESRRPDHFFQWLTAMSPSRLFIFRKRKQPLAAPDAHDPYVLRTAAVDDAKWRMEQFP